MLKNKFVLNVNYHEWGLGQHKSSQMLCLQEAQVRGWISFQEYISNWAGKGMQAMPRVGECSQTLWEEIPCHRLRHQVHWAQGAVLLWQMIGEHRRVRESVAHHFIALVTDWELLSLKIVLRWDPHLYKVQRFDNIVYFVWKSEFLSGSENG